MPVETGVVEIEWATFLRRMDWRQGEHVSMIGPTGGGKTTLALQILPKRMYTVAFVTKPRDKTFNGLRQEGFERVTKWAPNIHTRKVLLWPPLRKVEDAENQRVVFGHALGNIFTEGGWCIYADELRYLCETLKLQRYFEQLWQQGRALDISVVGIAQRPAWVPRSMYDQATHLFFWRDNDHDNLKRIGGLGGIDKKLVIETVSQLEKYQVLYVNSRTGELATTKVKVS